MIRMDVILGNKDKINYKSIYCERKSIKELFKKSYADKAYYTENRELVHETLTEKSLHFSNRILSNIFTDKIIKKIEKCILDEAVFLFEAPTFELGISANLTTYKEIMFNKTTPPYGYIMIHITNLTTINSNYLVTPNPNTDAVSQKIKHTNGTIGKFIQGFLNGNMRLVNPPNNQPIYDFINF